MSINTDTSAVPVIVFTTKPLPFLKNAQRKSGMFIRKIIAPMGRPNK